MRAFAAPPLECYNDRTRSGETLRPVYTTIGICRLSAYGGHFMRQLFSVLRGVFFLSISCAVFALFTPAAQAQCNITEAGDHVCGQGGPGPQASAPATPPGQAIPSTPPAPPIATSDVVDYSTASANTTQDVMPNLTQESQRLPAGQCAQRTIPPGSTTSIPFEYNGTNSAMNVPAVQGQGVTRTFISTMPGYDPMSRLSPGVQSDFYSPCHSQANLPEHCGESTCTPDPYNENSINMMNADTVSADPQGNATQCPLVPGQRYFINIQNQGSTPICTAVGNGTNCPPCNAGGGGGGGP